GEEVTLDFGGARSNCFVLARGVSHVVVSNLRMVNCGVWTVSLDGGNEDVTLSRLEISGGEAGIHMTVGESGSPPAMGPVRGVLIEDCVVRDAVFSGIDCTPGPCEGVTIRGCSIHGNGAASGFGGDGVAIESGDRILVEDCEVYGNGGDGVDVGSRNPVLYPGGSNVTVRRCVVRDNGLQGVKLWSGGVVENCLIASNGLDGLVFVYDGEYRVVNTAVVNNSPEYRAYSVCAGYPEPEPLGGQGDLRVHVYNTIVAFNGAPDAPTGIYLGEGVSFVGDYNLWYSRPDSEIYWEGRGDYTREDISGGRWTEETGNGAHSLTADPGFADLSAGDYHLTEGSPAVDSGSAEHAPPVDLEGRGRPCGSGVDIGPYELCGPGEGAPPAGGPPAEQGEAPEEARAWPEQPAGGLIPPGVSLLAGAAVGAAVTLAAWILLRRASAGT
ncbi:MAG: hypothetical protein DRO06_03285, partial [Thermoproteota archaeon]